jgi:hypothetical protein
MNWQAISAVSELVAALAVVASLIYLAVQIRQNTRALRSSTWQATFDVNQRFDSGLADNGELADILIRGHQGLEHLKDETERLRYMLVAKQLLDLYQNYHYQHELGMIDDAYWEVWIAAYRDAMAWPGFRHFVKLRRPFMRPGFERFVDQHLGSDDAH